MSPVPMYEGRTFRSISNSGDGDVDNGTTFLYHQFGDVVWATYAGGAVRFGTLIATVDTTGDLDMQYQHIAGDGSFKSGRCASHPERLADGRLRLHERWQWTGGAEGRGESVIEEISTR